MNGDIITYISNLKTYSDDELYKEYFKIRKDCHKFNNDCLICPHAFFASRDRPCKLNYINEERHLREVLEKIFRHYGG